MTVVAKGSWWRLHRDGVAAEALRGIINAGARWVLVGVNAGSPLILTVDTTAQQDVLPTFTSRTPAGSDPLNDVAYVASGVLTSACGDNGVIETSANQGQTWSSITLTGSPDMHGIVGVSGDALSRFVTVGVNEIWGQDNGGTWTQRWSGSQTWRSVAHRSGAGWVAVGDGGYASHSATGGAATWTAPYNFGIGNILKVASNNSYFMALSASGYLYRSISGLSSSWSLMRNFGITMRAIVPVLSVGSWVAFSQGLDVWLTEDDGDTWIQLPDLVRQVHDAHNQGGTAMTCGFDGMALVSYNQAQEDFVSTAVAETVPPALTANDDMAGDAVRRLVGQFRSSS